MNFNGQNSRVTTDSNGNYKLTIKWITPCRSVLKSRREYKQEVKKLNPKWIYLTCEGQVIRIKNQYKKYGNLFPDNEDQITRNIDLKFA